MSDPLPTDSKPETEERVQYSTGAVRCAKVAGEGKFPLRYELISTIGLRRLAATYGEGGLKYGDSNWLKGMGEKSLLQHVLAHLNEYRAGRKEGGEDDLAHAAWGLFSMMHFQETRPDMMDLFDDLPEGCNGR